MFKRVLANVTEHILTDTGFVYHRGRQPHVPRLPLIRTHPDLFERGFTKNPYIIGAHNHANRQTQNFLACIVAPGG